MTVIAWDGKTLAADKLLDCNGYPARCTKIYRAPNGDLYGTTGDSDGGRALQDWFVRRETATFPAACADSGSRTSMLVITAGGAIHLYCRQPLPIVIESTYFAVGSGADFALAGMELGLDAVAAVELASKLDTSCGLGVDTLTLKPPSAVKVTILTGPRKPGNWRSE